MPTTGPLDAGHVVFLNGAPSVGKSSTAFALRDLLETPHFYLGLDDYRRGYLDRAWLADDGSLFQQIVEPYLRNVAGLARAGHHVISESVLTPDNEALYLALFRGIPVLFVGLQCPLEVAVARESVRGDRRRGPMSLDHPLFHHLHDHDCYDLRVDTSTVTPEQAAARVAVVLTDPPQPSAFDRLRTRRRHQRAGSSSR
ncbi:MAG: phosphotransferase-like protein [Mycobacteriales bacterium]